ncbi:cullin-3-like [Rhipicephalus sanguineus]|uniref:cullin-3-like n=1 Tax=Rhipicephalus sanguineus TaxID=34632 RepID=UPI0020C3363B|nr:cullin-3-like [Rhipicephalus sanguineus]
MCDKVVRLLDDVKDTTFKNAAPELTHLYSTLQQFPGGVEALLDALSDAVRRLGRLIAFNSKSSSSLTPQMLNLHDHLKMISESSLKSDKRATMAIARAMEDIMDVDRSWPRYLYDFVEHIIVDDNREMRPVTREVLAKAMSLFRRLPSKRAFQILYKDRLSKRLLDSFRTPGEAEKVMIDLLKNECGEIYTRALQQMLHDIEASDELMEEFKAFRPDSHGVQLKVTMLTSGLWPVDTYMQKTVLPLAALSALNAYQKFYLDKYKGRRFNLLTNFGRAELSAIFYAQGDTEPSTSRGTASFKCYIISVTTLQMSVLLLFNNIDKLSYEAIASATNIPGESLIDTLQCLCTCSGPEPVLIKTPASQENYKDSIFSVNDGFKHDSKKVHISESFAATQEEKEIRSPTTDGDHRYQVDAVIVRTMKTNKIMTYGCLFIVVKDLLRECYLLSAAPFKQSLDALVERCYLEKAQDASDTYYYVP